MQEILQLLEKYVSLPSGPWEKGGAEVLTDAVARDFEAIGMQVKKLACEKVGPVLEATWGHGPRRLMLMGHLDTVFPQTERQPFRVEGDCIHGSGVSDMKGGIVIMRQALQQVLPTLDPAKHAIVAVMNCDEELGSPESGPDILRNAKECFAALSFEPSRPHGTLTIERKGVTSFHLRCTGIRGHAGAAYKQCASAIQELCQRIAALYTLRDDARDISLNIGVIRGGTAENVVSDEAEAQGEFRYYDQPYQAELMEKIRVICAAPGVPGTTCEVSFGAAHPALRRTDAAIALAEQAIAFGREQGRELSVETTGGAGDIAIVGLAGIPALDGLGMVGDGIHTQQEVGDLTALPLQIDLAAKMIVYMFRSTD